MSWYYNAATGETKEIDPAIYSAWQAANNPKASAYALIADPPVPYATYDGEQWQTYTPTLEQQREQMSCSPAQGRLALLQAGMLDTVEAWVASQSRAVQIEYDARTEWRRTWPLVVDAAEALGLTEAQLDDLFALAATL